MSARRTGFQRTGTLPDTNSGPASVPLGAHLALLGAGCLLALVGTHSQQATIPPDAQATAQLPNQGAGKEDQTTTLPVPLLVTKDRPLQPLSFLPSDLVDVAGTRLAAAAARDYASMTAAAAKEGVSIVAVSGFRSYAEQQELHARYQAVFGPGRAAELSAAPGHSEHQSGLAVDIADSSGQCPLMECFAGTPAGAWAAANAWKFGFIVRYPEGAQPITGFGYEPWHLRHVGKRTAGKMHGAGIPTLEEYLAGDLR